jgi:OmpA-OmpF porin, OOP family
MKRILVVAILSAVASAPAFANDTGFYVGANLGQATASGNIANNLSTSHSDTYMGILAGYQINKNLAAEVQYVDMGKLSQGSATAKTSGISVTAVGILPINEMFSVFGKLGVASTSVKVTSWLNETDNKTAVTVGLGGQYNINNSLGIRVGYDRYTVGKEIPVHTDGTYTVISAGVVYKF